MRRWGLAAIAVTVCALGAVALAQAQSVQAATPVERIPTIEIPSFNREALRREDAQRAEDGLPYRFAIAHPVEITPQTDGVWDYVGTGTSRWRLGVRSSGALSINLGFTRYVMPAGGQLSVYAANFGDVIGPYTELDNEDHGELWTPVVLGDDVIVELTLPTAVVDQLELRLTSINVGYRGFGETLEDRSQACEVDVICPEGDDWRDEIKSVGVISTGGKLLCTGFLVNNTAEDRTPYFMTAKHCELTPGNSASLVVYWNYESPTCGQQGGGSLSQYQTGSYFRAEYSTSDFTLVELDDDPLPEYEVVLAGWSRSTDDPTSAVCIHHPNADEKSISFEYHPCETTTYGGYVSPGNGTHIRVVDWDIGTTEDGSSGAPLFDQNHHIVGQVHGGWATCNKR